MRIRCVALPLLCLFTPVLVFTLARVADAQSASSATERYRGVTVRDVRMAYEGATIPEVARDLVDIRSGDAYHPEAIRRSIRQLFALGVFSDIKVEVERVGTGTEIDVLFRLFPRIEITAVELDGLGRPSDRLRKLSERLLEESGVRAGDPFEVERLEAASERIAQELRQQGYLWASVEPEASFQSPTAIVVFHLKPGRQARLRELAVDGAEPHVLTHVRKQVGLSRGIPYSRIELNERVDKLVADWNELGYYNASIDVRETLVESADVDVALDVTLGSRVFIEVRGTELSEKTVRELVPLFGENRLTGDLIEESRANIEDYLREQGYRRAAVAVSQDPERGGRSLYVRFDVTTGPRVEVVRIDFQGLYSLPERELRPLITTPTRRRFRSAPFRERQWAEDLEQVRRYLEAQGFHRADVDFFETALDDDGADLRRR